MAMNDKIYLWVEGRGWELFDRSNTDELRKRGIYIAPTAMIEDHAYIGIDVLIGDGACIGAWATIGDHSIIWKNAVIGYGATIGDRAIIRQNAVIGCYAKIGRRTEIEEGTIIKYYAIIGDNAIVTRNDKLYMDDIENSLPDKVNNITLCKYIRILLSMWVAALIILAVCFLFEWFCK